MKKYKMSWDKLLSTNSQRPRKGRKINDEIKNNYIDLRSDFERDYHRILSSPSFRRLQDKTQVFPLEKNDYVRTRLTHSIEVSSFGKSLAQSIAREIIDKNLDSSFTNEHAIAITNILASAGLLHDIGNPPFGHFGEDTIRAWFKNNFNKIEIKNEKGEYIKLGKILSEQMKKDFLFFEGNAQAIRVVSKLHFLVDENGMNLTYALLNTLIKYPVNSININKNSGNIKDKKMGYYLSEENLFNEIVKSTGTYNKKTGECYRHPLTFILEAADDIAYCTADIEDGMKKGFINFENLVETLKEKLTINEKLYENLIKYKKLAREKGYDSPESYAIQRWSVEVQRICINDAVNSFITNYEDIMNGEYKHDLFYNCESEKIIEILKNIAFKDIFSSKAIFKMEIVANNIINFLLDNFVKAILYWDTEYVDEIKGIDKRYINILSENQRHIYQFYSNLYINKLEKEYENIEKDEIFYEKEYRYKLYLRLLLVTDYLSGMTDSFIKTLYQELSGIK